MPRVPGRVVWRGGHSAIREPVPPIRLAFEVRAMTRGALLRVDHLPVLNELWIIRLGLAWLIIREKRNRSDEKRECRHQPAEQRSTCAVHLDRSDRMYLTSATAARTRTITSRSHISPAPHIIPPIPSIMRSIMQDDASDGLV